MRVPPPWIDYPDLPRDRHPPARAIKWFSLWLKFLYRLSPAALGEYQRDNPVPPGWDDLYGHVERLHEKMARLASPDFQANFQANFEYAATMVRMCETTTLK